LLSCIQEGSIPEISLFPRSRAARLLKFFNTAGKHPVKKLFDRCSEVSKEEFDILGISPTKVLPDKSMITRYCKFQMQLESSPNN
jgi:hypothetical protein